MPKEFAQKLKNARSITATHKQAVKDIKKKINPISLLKQLNPFIDWLFGIALALAILKDILDIVNTALIVAGGIGELLIIIFTFFISVIIFLILVITGSQKNVKLAKSIIKKFLIIIATAMSEMIPAIGMLPMETLLIVVVFIMTLDERRKGEEDQAKKINNQPTNS